MYAMQHVMMHVTVPATALVIQPATVPATQPVIAPA